MEDVKDSIFISYAKEDFNTFVSPIINALKKYYIDYWLDKDQINTGDKLFNKIEDRILKSNKFILFVSNTYTSKRWCRHELSMIIASNKTIIPIICGSESLKNIQNLPFINSYAFEELPSDFNNNDVDKIIHRIIKTIIVKTKINLYSDYKFVIEKLQDKNIHNKDMISYFIYLLSSSSNIHQKESIIIINNITDLIISNIIKKNNYSGSKSVFISKERFPQKILLSYAIIQNCKLLIMKNSNLCDLLYNNCTHALTTLLEWYLS